MLQFEAEYFGGNFNLKIDGGLRKTNVLLQVEESRLTVFSCCGAFGTSVSSTAILDCTV